MLALRLAASGIVEPVDVPSVAKDAVAGIERLQAIVTRLDKHRTKTRKAANKRIREHRQDGLAIQLQSAAGLLDMIWGEGAEAAEAKEETDER